MKKLLLAGLTLITMHTYADDYSQYWDAWHKEVKLVKQCTSNEIVASFLIKAIDNLGNAERSEANSEEIEKIIIKNPKCILSALPLLTTVQCNRVVKSIIEAPIFHEASEIQASIKSVHTGKIICSGS